MQADLEGAGGWGASLSLKRSGRPICELMAANNCRQHATITVLISSSLHPTKESTPSSPFCTWGKMHQEVKKFAEAHSASKQ